jgi:DNA-binding response OmpR family regulator
MLEEILQATYELDFEDEGRSGLATALENRHDLILLDVQLPGMDGFEICRTLKTNEATCDIPIIYITSLDSEEEKVKGFAAGGDDYVTKPFYPQELQARVRTHLALRRSKIQALNLERLTVFKEMAVAISHEFNNALTAVNVYLHLLEQEIAGGSHLASESLSGVIRECKRIGEVTNRLATASHAANINYSAAIKMIDLQTINSKEP